MLFAVKSPERVKRVAKSLADELQRREIPRFPYNRCLDLVAKMYGYRSFAAVVADDKKTPLSPDDALVPEQVALERRAFQVGVLVDAGIEIAVAEAVIDLVRPTDRSDRRKADLFEPIDRDLSDLASFMARRRRFMAAHLDAIGKEDSLPKFAGGFIDVADDATQGEPAHCLDSVIASRLMVSLLDMHDAGLGPQHLKTAVVEATLAAVDGSDAPDDVRKNLAEKLERIPTVAIPRECLGISGRCADLTNYPRKIAEAAAVSAPDAMDLIASFASFLDATAARGGTLSVLAALAGHNGFSGPLPLSEERGGRRFGQMLDLTSLYSNSRMGPKDAFPLLSAEDADAATVAAVRKVLVRGYPKLFEEDGYFDGGGSGFEEQFFVRPDGKALLATDVLVSAHRAGLGMADLVDGAIVAAQLQFSSRPSYRWVGLPSGHRETWKAAFARLRTPSKPVDPDLAATAMACELMPFWGLLPELSDPDAFVAGVEEMDALGRSGVDLASMAAFVCIANFIDISAPDARPDAGAHAMTMH